MTAVNVNESGLSAVVVHCGLYTEEKMHCNVFQLCFKLCNNIGIAVVGNLRLYSSSEVALWIWKNLEFKFALDYYHI